MKTLIAGANLPLSAHDAVLKFHYHVTQGELDISAYLLTEKTGKVRGDADMLFFGQRYAENGAIALDIGENRSTLRINTTNIAPEIKKIAICATIDGAENLSVLDKLQFTLKSGGEEIATAQEESKTRHEAALILAEIYRHNGLWKCRWVMQGFHGGLRVLAEYFGIEVAEEEESHTPEENHLSLIDNANPTTQRVTENIPPQDASEENRAENPIPPTDNANPTAQRVTENIPPQDASEENRAENPIPPVDRDKPVVQNRVAERHQQNHISPTSNLPTIILNREESNFRIYRGGEDFGCIKINLNWELDSSRKSGFLSNLLGMGTIDLDLGAMVRLKDGSSHVVQALGNHCGSRYNPPFIELQGDDRTGENQGGEWLFLSGEHWQEIDLVVVFCFVYRGKKWPITTLSIDIPHHRKIEVPLGEYDQNLGLCGVVELRNQSHDINVQRIMKYFFDHKKLDQHYGFGIEWTKKNK